MLATEVQTRSGRCATHGEVEATRELPRPHFPFMVFAVRRFLASRKPYRCPDCGEPVTTS